jgi:DNA-binding winged helix-turn-helix (wHTH) protein
MKTATARTALFGPYSLDLRSGELRKHGIKLKMGEQPFQILRMLLERPGELVTREELRAKLWADDTFVDFDHGLNSAVQRLRDCLSDTAEKPLWIETVPRRGYRFIASIEGVPADLTRPSEEETPSSGKQASAISPLAVLSPRGRWLVVAGAVVAMLAIGGYLYFHRTPKLTERDPIIVADFTNTTGDPVFDGTLRQGLSVQLEQTPFLQLVSDDRVGQTLRLMEKPPDTRLTRDVAREVCQRARGVPAIHVLAGRTTQGSGRSATVPHFVPTTKPD